MTKSMVEENVTLEMRHLSTADYVKSSSGSRCSKQGLFLDNMGLTAGGILIRGHYYHYYFKDMDIVSADSIG